MPAVLWVSASALSVAFAVALIFAANEVPVGKGSLYVLLAVPLPLYLVLLLFGLAYIAGKVKRLEERIDNQRP
jgi:hypothetical protein